MTNSSSTTPPWQSQDVFDAYRAQLNKPNHQKNVSMFSSLKSSLKRKESNSAKSVSSQNTAAAPGEFAPSFRGPVELAASMEQPRSGIHGYGRDGSPISPIQGPNPITGLSAPTRRPDRPGMNAFTVPSNEPPPAYTPSPVTPTSTVPNLVLPNDNSNIAASMRSPSPAPSTTSIQQTEDKYAFLTIFDTVLLIDDSGSMAGRSWRETAAALTQLLPIIVARDSDGIDLYFLNHLSSDPGVPGQGIAAGGYRNVRTAEEVTSIFQRVRPGAGTPTGLRLRAILQPYITHLEREKSRDAAKMDNVKPLNVLTITDGVPNDDVESVLLQIAKKLDNLEAAPHQVGVQFFQVGNEEGAAEALRELDDGLVDLVQGGVRDMVDTCTWMGGQAGSEGATPSLSAEGILKVVLGAVVKRLDRRRASAELRR